MPLYEWPMTVHLSHWVGFWKQESIQKQDVTGCWIIPWGLRDESVNNSPSVFAKQHIKPPTPTCLTSGENHQWEMKLFNHFCLKIPFCWKPIHSSKYWISDLFVQWLTKLAIYFHKIQTGYLNSSIMIDMVTATINVNVDLEVHSNTPKSKSKSKDIFFLFLCHLSLSNNLAWSYWSVVNWLLFSLFLSLSLSLASSFPFSLLFGNIFLLLPHWALILIWEVSI